MKILVKSPFSPFSGYGNDGIGMVLALMAKGHDVYLQPTHVDAPLPPAIAALFTKELEAPFDLAIIHTDPAQMECTPEMRGAVRCVVGWTMWEYTTLDNLYMNRRSLKKRLANFDGYISYDQVTADAHAKYLGKGTASIIQQGGFDPELWPEQPRVWDEDRFGFCMVGALHNRKDPFVAIQAFRELKTEYPEEFEPAELHLKTNVPGLHPQMEEWTPKLRVHYTTWPADTLRRFYKEQHVLLAPSRGEGKNMPALEMMSTGGTVIATNWGGHQQWLNSSYAYPLNYVLRPEDKYPDCMSARADKDHLKELMLHVFRNRAEARAKGELAAKTIPAMCSWDAVLDRLFLQLRSIPNGDRVYTMSQMVRQS